MCRKYKFKVQEKFSRFDWFKLKLVKRLKKHVEVVNLNNHPLPKKCIMIGNHFAASGPFNYKIFIKHQLDHSFMFWAAWQMHGGFNRRRRYMYNTFYRQKLGYGRFRSWFLSIITGWATGTLYKTAGTIPVYYDARLKDTFKYSLECLEKGVSVMIFPENSNDGYKDIITDFYSGYLALTKLHYKRHGEDLPMHILRYEKNPSKIVIGKAFYYQELAKTYTDSEITQMIIDYLNGLKSEFILPCEQPLITQKITTSELLAPIEVDSKIIDE